MSDNEETLVLRNLQGLLQNSIGKDVQVIDYQTSLLLQKDENFGSTMLKVEAVVKKTKDSPEENMHFVAKFAVVGDFHKRILNLEASFPKEIFVIDILRKWYRQLERETGVKEVDLIDVFPKFHGERWNNKMNDAVILMENLIVRGYKTMDKLNGMDFDHMKFAIKEYARFHALGVVLRIKKPDLWEAARKIINAPSIKFPSNECDDITKQIVEYICADPRIRKYKDRIENSLIKCNCLTPLTIVEEVGPWASIVHGDTWVDNMLFHHTENGMVDGVKFVDYQVARMCSPLKDLPYFLCACGNIDVMENHFDELLDIYYKKFFDVLAKMGCDTSPFTKESFEDKLKKDANDELFHCMVALKMVTMQVPQDMDMRDLTSLIILANPNQLFLDRAWRTISKFVEKSWI